MSSSVFSCAGSAVAPGLPLLVEVEGPPLLGCNKPSPWRPPRQVRVALGLVGLCSASIVARQSWQSCPSACEIFLDQGLPCPLHCQADFQPLTPKESPQSNLEKEESWEESHLLLLNYVANSIVIKTVWY